MGFASQVETGSGTISPIASTLYGYCNTAAATAAKVVTLADYDELIIGTTVHVKFINGNTAASPTLAVGSTAAKPIYVYGTTTPGNTPQTSWYANSVISFTYDGTAWRMNDVGANDAIVFLINSEASARTAADTAYQLKNIAAYSDSNTYTKGQLVTNSGQFYKANQNIDEAEEWTAAHWDLVTIGEEIEDRELKMLRFSNVSVPTTAWETAGGHTDYPKRASVALTGVTSAMIPYVSLGYAQAESGDYSSFTESYDGGIYIYAASTPSAAITIPTVVCWRP